MLRNTLIYFLILIQSILFAQSPNKAKVKFVIGNVELQKNQQINWVKLGLNYNVYEGDRIKTLSNSRVELDMPDGSILKINENAVFDINELKTPESDGEDKMSFTLWVGKLWGGFKKIFSDRQERTIESPSAVVAIRGTTIEMDVDIQQKTTVRVIEGSVSVKSKDTDNEVIVTSNQKTIVEKGKAPTDPESFIPDEGEETEGKDFPFRVNLRQFVFTDPAVLGAGIPVSGKIPEGAKLFANDIAVPVTATGSFNARLRVVEGVNEINLQAIKEDKSVSRTIKVYVNTKKPDIRLSSPLVSGFYNRRDYSLSGGVFDLTPNDKIKITLNGEELTEVEGRGSFNRTII
ncbi:MAG: FecR domain-containing protein, partial [Calditrichia bacterium]|nr:FecR domain-containing protein [Calditrichia bacterium]